MPVYEYKCDQCGRIIEVLARMSENVSVQECPNCGTQRSFTKQFSTFASHTSHTEAGCCGGMDASRCEVAGGGCGCGAGGCSHGH